MEYETIIVERPEPRIARIVMNRPSPCVPIFVKRALSDRNMKVW
jgi:hypothetical protein